MSVERQVSIATDTDRLYEEIGRAGGLSAWLGPAQFKVNQQFGSVLLKLFGELDFSVSETRSPLGVTWRCLNRRHAWARSSINFGFEAAGESVVVKLHHVGLADEAGVLATTGDFWAGALDSLKLRVEVGVGAPFEAFPSTLSSD